MEQNKEIKISPPPLNERGRKNLVPRDVRLMALKNASKLTPMKRILFLYSLQYDPDGGIKASSRRALMLMPPSELEDFLLACSHPKILDFFAKNLPKDSHLLELIAENRATAKSTLEYVKSIADKKPAQKTDRDDLTDSKEWRPGKELKKQRPPQSLQGETTPDPKPPVKRQRAAPKPAIKWSKEAEDQLDAEFDQTFEDMPAYVEPGKKKPKPRPPRAAQEPPKPTQEQKAAPEPVPEPPSTPKPPPVPEPVKPQVPEEPPAQEAPVEPAPQTKAPQPAPEPEPAATAGKSGDEFLEDFFTSAKPGQVKKTDKVESEEPAPPEPVTSEIVTQKVGALPPKPRSKSAFPTAAVIVIALLALVSAAGAVAFVKYKSEILAFIKPAQEEIELPPEEPPIPPEPEVVKLARPATIIIGKYTSSNKVKKARRKIEKLGFVVDMTTKKEKKTYWSVSAGSKPTREEANRRAAGIRSLGIGASVGGRGPFYISCGRYTSESKARKKSLTLRASGYPGRVRKSEKETKKYTLLIKGIETQEELDETVDILKENKFKPKVKK